MPIKSLTILICSLLLALGAKAQLVCDFKADTTRACAPYQITFTDLSSGPRPITYWQWDFGNNGFSNLKNPSRVYTNPGLYTVKLTVSDGVDTARKTIVQYIHIFKVPAANFNLTKLSNCKPMPVTFQDNSSLGDAPIATYSWDYGDLSPPGSGSSTSHTYPFNGTYSVFLTVVDTNGCTSTSNPQNVVVDAPDALFTGSPRADCLPPLAVTFSNSSTGSAPLSYQWYFGDGGTSTQANPSHSYTTSGTFDVMLVVTDNKGCVDTIRRNQYISIGQTKADFTIPDTVCIGVDDTIFNTSTGANTFQWNFTGGSTSTARDPIFRFNTSGIKTITLKASAGTNCQDSLTKTIYVEEVNAGFVLNYDSICVPNFVSFKDSSSANVASSYYHLDLGPTQQDVYKNGPNNSYKFQKSPCRNTYYVVNYHVQTSNGCTASTSKQVKIYNDQIFGQVNSSSPCVPATNTFSATPCLRFKDVKWHWDFGTGNPGDTSNVQSPTNVISVTQPGRYIAKVTVTDSVGCVYEHNVPYELGAKQTAGFNFPDTICYGDTVYFQNTSVDSNAISGYAWDFGDKTFDSKRHPVKPYEDLGRFKITLTVWNYSCEDSLSQYIYVSGPRVSIVSRSDCKNPLDQLFLGNIVGGYNWFRWDFDDGSPFDSTNLTVNHIFSTAKPYHINLVAYNDTTGCKDSATMLLDPKPLIASFSPTLTSVCQYTEIQYDALSSKGNINGQYFWDFGDGGTDKYNRRPKHKFDSTGVFDVRLIIVSTDSCFDTLTVPMAVTGINPNYNLPPEICSNDSMTILNLSTPDTIIRNYRWSIDNGLKSLDSNFNYRFALDTVKVDSSLLLNSDTIRVSLYMEDALGCRDSLIKFTTIHDVRADYSLSDSSLCRDGEVIFTDTRLPSNTGYVWIFGDGDTSKAIEPKHKYQQSGTYNAQYVVFNGPCSDTMTIPVDVQGIDSVQFLASITDTNCYPATIFFDDLSVGDSIVWRTWDFGDGIVPIRSPLKDSLTKTFLNPGLFSVKVVVETSNGCLDSTTYSDYIHIKGPYAQFSIYPDSVCVWEEITFVRDTSNIYTKSMVWDFADGRVDTTGTNVDTLKHRYDQARSMLAILLFEDSAGTCKKFFSRDVVVEDVHANFIFNPDSVGCEPFTASLADNSVDGDTWDWRFGDGGQTTTQNPTHQYLEDGTYDMTLYYSNSRNGCRDTLTKQVLVHPLPLVQGMGDTTVCLGDSAQLSSFGARSYLWSPADFLNNSILQDPMAAPTNSFLYTVTGTDSNTCVNSDQVLVSVQQVPTITLPDDQQIIVGESFDISTQTTDGRTYRWEPAEGLSCADCANPSAQPLENTTYTLYVKDSLGCFEVQKSFSIEVIPKFSVDVPEAFTPNGDGNNDVIYPNGWGIKDILEFKIYNRWGELVFEATEDTPGWDGYYKGELQNIETYVYYVKAISYGGEVETKEGFISLVR